MSSKTDHAAQAPAYVAVALTVTLAIAAALRFFGLQSGLWFDEIVTLVESARLPIRQIVTQFPGVNAHPLYSVLGHAAISAFGESAWALRLPAALFGVASVWMAYVLGARIIGRTEALVGAVVLATSYHHIWFSQNARGYTMLGFFALVATHALLRAGESGRTRDYVIYALAAAAGIYTHLTMVFVVAGHAIVMAAGRGVGWRPTAQQPFMPLVWAYLGAGVLSVALYAPFMSALVDHLGADAPRQAAQVATGGWALAEALRSVLSGAGVPAAILSGAVALIGAVSLIRRAPLALALLVAPVVVTAGALIVLGQPLRPRFFFFLSGAAAVFVGSGAGALARAIATRITMTRPATDAVATPVAGVALCAAVLVAVSVVALPRNYQVPKQDFDGAVSFLTAEESGGARIAAAGPACLPLESYFGKTAWPCLKTLAELGAFTALPSRVLVVHTLGDYIEDPALRDRLRRECAVTKRFPGTLGGGDMVICDPRRPEGP